MGLAWAISEHLMESIGAATLFATHFHELTALQGAVGVKNLHVKCAIDAASGGLTMLYQVNEGSCDQSLGVHVAEFARFPPEVVEAARKKAAELENFAVEGSAAGGEAMELGPGEGRKRKAGDAGVRDALVEFASTQLEGMSVEELTQQAHKWAEALRDAGQAAPKPRTAVA